MRFDRKMWRPYIRVIQWVFAPLSALYLHWTLKKINPRTDEDWKRERIKWKHKLKTGDADDYYMFGVQSKIFQKGPASTESNISTISGTVPSGDDMAKLQSKSVRYQFEAALSGEPFQ